MNVKKLLIYTIAILMMTVVASAQTAKKKPAKVASKSKAAKPFIREKFDPLRDPKADLASAVRLATQTGKRIILDVGGEWCGWCVHMDKYFYLNPPLEKLRDANFVWVKINMSDENENKEFLAAYPAIDAYPFLFVLEKDGTLLHAQETGSLEAKETYDLNKFTTFLKTWAPSKP